MGEIGDYWRDVKAHRKKNEQAEQSSKAGQTSKDSSPASNSSATSWKPDVPVELPNGRLVCRNHGLVRCDICCCDYSFMEESDEDNEDDEEGGDDEDEGAYPDNVEDEEDGDLHTPTDGGSEILLLNLYSQSFFEEAYASLIGRLSSNVNLKRAKTASGAIRYLEANNPKAVFVTDRGLIMQRNKHVLDKVLVYLQNGGLVIVGLHFPSFIERDEFDRFFGNFGLPWKSGDYQRTTFRMNPSSVLPKNAKSQSVKLLLRPYSMKAIHIKDARPHEKIFIPESGAQTQSLVFPPAYVDEAQAAVVGAKVRNGYLVYHGDVNGEKASDVVLLVLCGI